MTSRPLDGITVVDLTTTLSGPYATLTLAQLGAEVIKVEAPPKGDVTRSMTAGRSPGMGSLYLNMNHGKKGIVLDLKRSNGQAVLLRILERADVFVHNMRHSAVTGLGLDYGALSDRYPGLIYCYASGFGISGPYGDRPAYDDVIQGMSGIASIQGRPGDPSYINSVVVDKVVALTLSQSVLAGIIWRSRHGRGCEIEVPMFETMAAFTLVEHMGGRTFEPAEGPSLYPRSTSPYRRPYRTQDSFISVLVYTDDQWGRFLPLVGRADLLDDPRFATALGRVANIDHVYAFVEETMATDTTASWLRRLSDVDIPVGPVNTVDQLLDDQHLHAVSLVEQREHPSEGPLHVLRPSVVFDRKPWSPPEKAAPRLGEDTHSVLSIAGYTDQEIDSLLHAGVAYEAAERPHTSEMHSALGRFTQDEDAGLTSKGATECA